ncbi:MAG: cellulase family glycosylhydrolase [Segetibacter sp.]
MPLIFLCSPIFKVKGQSRKLHTPNLVYVDKNGILRYTNNNAEAAFFGVNYTVPFAYGYRSVKRTGIDIEKAIDQDVYHLARLGLDAFRVHVWDTEISDSTGNLLENDHLRLFDYLLFKLKQRKIKILITPIAFWGNGYPEKDGHTPGFSTKYGKQQAVVNEDAIKAQENYLKQFFQHVNPYTKLTYKDDPDVIATELNNEPHHSGLKEKATEYVNRLATAVRSTGWTKPIFYNISESPSYADAVAKANVDGHSFQWYPTGLVANHTLQGNFLPNVDKYIIPFDTITTFKKRAKMVYEFDAGDVLQSNMYPAMARSFRGAGFQWATQFAYDPMATAYANTEYQTHYLNLAYTPSKAISLMIASKAFHRLPRNKSYGTYPADSVFDVFRVSYKEQLSEMNSPEEFYYSNSTSSKPINLNQLQHIAGVGSSFVVNYDGYGTYFIDKVSEGVWRLEVMPDAIHIRDPFEKASPKKEVTRIQWQNQLMKIVLPELGENFKINALNEGNTYSTSAINNVFTIHPGSYLITKSTIAAKLNSYPSSLKEFAAPKPVDTTPFVVHTPFIEVSENNPFTILFKIVGVDAADKISIELHNSSGTWKTFTCIAKTAYDYIAEVPSDIVNRGVINYRIIIEKAGGFYVFPGNHHGDPHAWDAFENETWQTFVASKNADLQLFNPNTDQTSVNILILTLKIFLSTIQPHCNLSNYF